MASRELTPLQAALLVGVLFLAATDVGARVGNLVDWLEDGAREEGDFQAAREFRDLRATLVRVREIAINPLN